MLLFFEMDKETVLAKLCETTLIVMTITSIAELMNCYAMQHDDRNTKLIAEFLREFTLGSADKIEKFDAYVQQEAFRLMSDEEVLPLLIAYVKAKVRFNLVIEKLGDDEVLDAELIGSFTELS